MSLGTDGIRFREPLLSEQHPAPVYDGVQLLSLAGWNPVPSRPRSGETEGTA